MADVNVTRQGTLQGGISFTFNFRWWDTSQCPDFGTIDPTLVIEYLGSKEALRNAGCIDDRMWDTLGRGGRKGHCGRDQRGEEWSRRNQATDEDPHRMVIRRRMAVPAGTWPDYLPAVADLRQDVRREVRTAEANAAEKAEWCAKITLALRDLTPDERAEFDTKTEKIMAEALERQRIRELTGEESAEPIEPPSTDVGACPVLTHSRFSRVPVDQPYLATKRFTGLSRQPSICDAASIAYARDKRLRRRYEKLYRVKLPSNEPPPRAA